MSERMRTLLATSVLVHLVGVALAAVAAAPAAWFFADATGELGADVARSDSLLEAIVAARNGGASRALYGLAIAAGSMLVLHAPVQMVWLHALARAPGRSPLRAGLRRSGAALVVSLLVYGAGLVFALASICPALAAHLALQDHANVRLHDLVVLAMSAPVALVAFCVALLHDLARAALVDPSRVALVAVLAAVRELRVRRALEYAGFLAAALAGTALAVATSVLGGTAWGAAAAILGAHLLLVGRTVLRGAWLARCVAATSAGGAAPVADAAGDGGDQIARLAG